MTMAQVSMSQPLLLLSLFGDEVLSEICVACNLYEDFHVFRYDEATNSICPSLDWAPIGKYYKHH